MKKIRKGDKITIKNCEGTTIKYYAGIDNIMKYGGLNCVFLADDIKNKNTYSRYSQQKLQEYGYII